VPTVVLHGGSDGVAPAENSEGHARFFSRSYVRRVISRGGTFPGVGSARRGVYAEDTWHITETLVINFGTPWEIASGFTNGSQVSPMIKFFYQWRF
jgi:hypothetical protein